MHATLMGDSNVGRANFGPKSDDWRSRPYYPFKTSSRALEALGLRLNASPRYLRTNTKPIVDTLEPPTPPNQAQSPAIIGRLRGAASEHPWRTQVHLLQSQAFRTSVSRLCRRFFRVPLNVKGSTLRVER